MKSEIASQYVVKVMAENDTKLPMAQSRHWLCFIYTPEDDGDIIAYDAAAPARLVASLKDGKELVDIIGCTDSREAERQRAVWNTQAKTRRILMQRYKASLDSQS